MVATAVVLDVQLDQRAAKDVPGVEELESHAPAYLPRLVHVRRLEEMHQRVHVGLFVQRLEELLALPAALLVHILEIALLEKARIAKHDVAKLCSGLSREDAAPEALPDKLRQVAGMVYVRVREYDVVYGRRVHRKVAVLLERLLAMSLVQSAVEEDPLSVRLDEMHRPRGRLRGSIERYSHRSSTLLNVSTTAAGGIPLYLARSSRVVSPESTHTKSTPALSAIALSV